MVVSFKTYFWRKVRGIAYPARDEPLDRSNRNLAFSTWRPAVPIRHPPPSLLLPPTFPTNNIHSRALWWPFLICISRTRRHSRLAATSKCGKSAFTLSLTASGFFDFLVDWDLLVVLNHGSWTSPSWSISGFYTADALPDSTCICRPKSTGV